MEALLALCGHKLVKLKIYEIFSLLSIIIIIIIIHIKTLLLNCEFPTHTSFTMVKYFARVCVQSSDLLFLAAVYRNERDQRRWSDGGAAHVLPGWHPAVSAARGAVPKPGSSRRAGGNLGGPLYTVSYTSRFFFLCCHFCPVASSAVVFEIVGVNCSVVLGTFDTLIKVLWAGALFIRTGLRKDTVTAPPSVMMWLGDTTNSKAEK